MPFFEYQCATCDNVFTLLQPRTAEREGHACPACESTATSRILSTFATGRSTRTAPAPPCESGQCCGPSCQIESY